ncbi:MAG: pseudaminic acid synthase [Candidatus Omnitrophota bacterium]
MAKNEFMDFLGCPDRVCLVAEVSCNHGGDLKRAIQMIRTAKECGADAVKFQTYTPDSLTLDVKNRYFTIHHPKWGGQTLYQLYKKTAPPLTWFKRLKEVADEVGIVFFSTALDAASVDLLETLDVPCHKLTSFELVDLGLVRCAARTGKPLILSTGMATIEEIREAVQTAKRAGASRIALLKCLSSYPAPWEQMNLRTIPDLRRRFRRPVGLSDHSLGTHAAVAAVALGAVLIEKHFILSKKIKTPDSFFSIVPSELEALVKAVRIVEKSLGQVHYGLTDAEQKSKVFRRSLFVARDVKKGEVFTEENVRSVRPSNGLSPKYLPFILGKRARVHVAKGTPLSPKHIQQLSRVMR